jgi:hypothetical protein
MEKEELKKIVNKHPEGTIFRITTKCGNYLGAVELNDNTAIILESPDPEDRESIPAGNILSAIPVKNLELVAMIYSLMGAVSLHCEAIRSSVEELGKTIKKTGLRL